MITKYRLCDYGQVESRIEKIEVASETNCFVVFENGRKDAKNAGGFCYFDTFEQARAKMFKDISAKCDATQKRLDVLRENLKKAFTLTENGL